MKFKLKAIQPRYPAEITERRNSQSYLLYKTNLVAKEILLLLIVPESTDTIIVAALSALTDSFAWYQCLRLKIAKTLEAEIPDNDALGLSLLVLASINKCLDLSLDSLG